MSNVSSRDDTLNFVAVPNLLPPEVEISPSLISQGEADLKEAHEIQGLSIGAQPSSGSSLWGSSMPEGDNGSGPLHQPSSLAHGADFVFGPGSPLYASPASQGGFVFGSCSPSLPSSSPSFDFNPGPSSPAQEGFVFGGAPTQPSSSPNQSGGPPITKIPRPGVGSAAQSPPSSPLDQLSFGFGSPLPSQAASLLSALAVPQFDEIRLLISSLDAHNPALLQLLSDIQTRLFHLISANTASNHSSPNRRAGQSSPVHGMKESRKRELPVEYTDEDEGEDVSKSDEEEEDEEEEEEEEESPKPKSKGPPKAKGPAKAKAQPETKIFSAKLVKDPNAPKKPLTAYMQYTQERRSTLVGQVRSELYNSLQLQQTPFSDCQPGTLCLITTVVDLPLIEPR